MYVPVDEEPGDAVHAGSCSAKRHSDENAFTDIPPDSIGTSAVQAQTTENLADESLFFSGEAASGSQMMTQEVMVPVAGPPQVLGRSVREPRGADREKIVEVQQVQTTERIVEVLQIQCQEVIRHVTASQIQEVIQLVTVLPRWRLRLMSDPTECVFVDSDTRYSWNPSTMLPGTASHRPISQTSWSVWTRRTVCR